MILSQHYYRPAAMRLWAKITSLRYASLHTLIFEVFPQNSQGHFQIFEDYIYSHWFWGQTKAAMLPPNAKTWHTASWMELLDLI